MCNSLKEISVLIAAVFLMLHPNKVDAAKGSIVAALVVIFVAIFGETILQIMANRAELYLYSESVRGALYNGGISIANINFPFGSGAGTYVSGPSIFMNYSSLYDDYGVSDFTYGGGRDAPFFLSDVGYPKLIAEAGWIGGGAYILGLLGVFFRTLRALKTNNQMSHFCFLMGVLILAVASAGQIFTLDIGVLCLASYLMVDWMNPQELKRVSKNV